MSAALDELEREAEDLQHKRDKWRGPSTSTFRQHADAKRAADGCEVCERGLINLFHDYVDGLHRFAGAAQKNMRLLEREEQALELATRRHLDGEPTPETAGELMDALVSWLNAVKRSRGEVDG